MRAVSLAAIAACASGALAQAPPALEDAAQPPPLRMTSVSLLWENDGRYYQLFDERDRWYTNGTKIDVTLNRPWPNFAPQLLPFAWQYDDPKEAGGAILAQRIFSPEDISETELIEDDRPWAGYLYTGVYVQQADEYTLDHLELDLGVVGEWSGGEVAQEFVHDLLPNQIEPRGWGNQLDNEPTVLLKYARRWRTPRVYVGDLELDAIGQAGLRLGNVYTDAGIGATARAGFNIPDDFGPPRIDGFRDATGRWPGDFGIYGYARIKGRAVAHNIFLDGNTFASSHSVEREPLVGSLQVGLVARYRALEVGWSQTWRTNRFEGQRDSHAYGLWLVALRFRY